MIAEPTVRPIAPPPVVSQVEDFPPWTEEEHEEMLQSVFWFHKQRSLGKLCEYEGKYVAILNFQILDADADDEELFRRLEPNPSRTIVVQRIPGPDEIFNW